MFDFSQLFYFIFLGLFRSTVLSIFHHFMDDCTDICVCEYCFYVFSLYRVTHKLRTECKTVVFERKATVADRSVEMFCLLLMYVNINAEPDPVQGSRPAAVDSAAAVMIHPHTGETRPCAQVSPLLSPVLPAPITHAYCTLTCLLTVC